MSDLIEIKLGAEIADDGFDRIRQQLAEFEKAEKIKFDIDTASISKKIKEVEKDVGKITGAKGKKLQIFDESELKKNGVEVTKVKDSVKKSIKEIEDSYKKMGKTSVVWNESADGVDKLTVKVKESESVTKQYKHTLVELADGQKAWIKEGVRGSEDQARGVSRLLTEQSKLLTVENQLNTARKQVAKLDPQSEEYKKLSAEVERLDNLQTQYNANLKNIDTTKIKELQTQTKELGVETKKAIDNMPESISSDKLAGDVEKMGRSMVAMSAPIVAMGGAAIKASIDFESAFAGVKKTVSASEEEFAELEKSIREMSKAFPQSASEIAQVGEIAGQLGIAKEDIMDFTEVMVMLGDTTNMTSETAATNIARFANIMNMSSDDYERLGSVVVDLGKIYCPVTWKQVA